MGMEILIPKISAYYGNFFPNSMNNYVNYGHFCSGKQFRLYTTSLPKGVSASPASLKCILPKGMPIIVM